jgi:tyrosine-protein kinase Etk/Wzc
MNRNSRNSSNFSKKEKSLTEIFHIIYKRKWILIFSVLLTLIAAYIYNLLSAPIYESTVILKKETADKNNLNNDFMEIVRMQTQDEVETEIELVKTIEVLSKVVKDLNLFLQYKKLITSSGETIILNKPLLDYSNPKFNREQLPFQLPQIISVYLKDNNKSAEYYIERVDQNKCRIYDALTGELIETVEPLPFDSTLNKNTLKNLLNETSDSSGSSFVANNYQFNTSLATFNLIWSEVPVGSRFYFAFSGFNSAVDGLYRQISVGRTGKTNLFTVSVVSPSPFSAAKVANVLIDKFRESRIDQQKQTIRYSFNFIDGQLQEMQLKLRESEDNLSAFKSGSQITTIDASSQEIVKFLSTLEAERLNSELQLNEYRNKLEDMKKQMQSTGYFDPTLLSPEGQPVGGSDPFGLLVNQLSNLELKRLELLQKKTENHPDVISLDEQINLAKQKLASYNQNTLTAYQILINSLEKKRTDINNLLSKYEVKLELLPSQENKFARLLREKTVYEKMFTLLLDKREEMRMAELSKLQDIIIVDPAREPLKPIGPKKLFNLLIAFVLGSFAGIMLIFIVELKNSKLVNLDELEADFQIRILSIIPKYTRAIKNKIVKANDIREKFVNLIDEQSGFKETYSLLKTKIELQLQERKKIFMITSCEENSGKSTIVANLALSFAQNSKRVLIIDCDLRKSGLSRIFEVANENDGLIDYLSKGTPPKLHTRVSKIIDILPTGGLTLDSSNLLNSERMENLFSLIDTSVYDYIIIDTPPVTKVVDTLILGKYIKDAILVVRPDLSLKENVKGGLQDLTEAKIKVRGIIVNAAELTKSYYYKNRYGYGYGYGYGSKSTSKGEKLKRKVSKTFSIN